MYHIIYHMLYEQYNFVFHDVAMTNAHNIKHNLYFEFCILSNNVKEIIFYSQICISYLFAKGINIKLYDSGNLGVWDDFPFGLWLFPSPSVSGTPIQLTSWLQPKHMIWKKKSRTVYISLCLCKHTCCENVCSSKQWKERRANEKKSLLTFSSEKPKTGMMKFM